MIVYTTAIIFLLALDRLFKALALARFFSEPVKAAGDIIKLSFSRNYNIAFSIPLKGEWLNCVILIIVIALIYYFLFAVIKNRDYQTGMYLVFIILGAASNLCDRFRLGYVVDYIDLKYFTVFNIADIMIVGGVMGILYYSILKKQPSL